MVPWLSSLVDPFSLSGCHAELHAHGSQATPKHHSLASCGEGLALLISAARHLVCREHCCRITGIWDVDIDGSAREHFGLEMKAYDTLRVTQRGRTSHICVKNLKL
jgi:hypothetical protein